ncbi:hypothetical protein [Pseudomonas sp. GL-R-26]|uniref:hypothetical protein n=1 Tax=Pseudomonas sp. GL-R-26 TaxID=2832392 RepID=UPI001CBD6BC2|nr:hypothetical protein [Pseudomonas sp. GL-R-26]
MDYAQVANVASLVAGLLSAVFWVVAAVVKAPVPPEFKGKPDGDYWKCAVIDGGELFGTLRLQSKWNSWAAFAAAATVLLQIAASMLSP